MYSSRSSLGSSDHGLATGPDATWRCYSLEAQLGGRLPTLDHGTPRRAHAIVELHHLPRAAVGLHFRRGVGGPRRSALVSMPEWSCGGRRGVARLRPELQNAGCSGACNDAGPPASLHQLAPPVQKKPCRCQSVWASLSFLAVKGPGSKRRHKRTPSCLAKRFR